MKRHLAAAILVLAAACPARGAGSRPIRLEVDARDATRGLFHARLELPVSAGPLTLLYPKWLPGEHGPTGPIVELAGLKCSAAGRPVAWRRDDTDMYTFHLDVPAGAQTLEVRLDYISPASVSGEGYGNTPNATEELAAVLWNQLLLYPAGRPARAIPFHAVLRLPEGWRFATALPLESREGDTLSFAEVSLETLVDSPVLAGAHFRAVDLGDANGAPVRLDMAADSEAALAIPPDFIDGYRNLVAQANRLFGARHYRHYDFLLALSDFLDADGLEHHESSDDRVPERTFLDSALRTRWATLLPHEYFHSWNGKYRRPTGLATPDYQTPMKGDLLWIYEGLTRYYGDLVLTSRAGLRGAAETREYVAWVAARLADEPGRQWRPLEDTAVAAQLLYSAPGAWASWRRGVDFYDESLLIWLEADAIIRQRSGGKKSLDDFCRRFYGGQNSRPQVDPYALSDVLDALNAVCPYDWDAFFRDRVRAVTVDPPLGGLAKSGWTLVYSASPNSYGEARDASEKDEDLSHSLGVWVSDEGQVLDVVPDSSAARAGLAPGMKIVAVNSREWSADRLTEAVKSSAGSREPLSITADHDREIRTYVLDYHGGERHPHLEALSGKPDLLSEITRPLSD
jgi:predicted metalloprotease with PDZ domain